jgi:hypothetical protein
VLVVLKGVGHLPRRASHRGAVEPRRPRCSYRRGAAIAGPAQVLAAQTCLRRRTRISCATSRDLLRAGCGALAALEPAATPEPAAETRNPRQACLDRAANGDLHPDFAGLRDRPRGADARPCIHEFAGLGAVGRNDERADVAAGLAGGDEQAPERLGGRPASMPTRARSSPLKCVAYTVPSLGRISEPGLRHSLLARPREAPAERDEYAGGGSRSAMASEPDECRTFR